MDVMKILATCFKRPSACTAALTASHPAAGHCRPTPPPETPGHSWACLGQSLVGSRLLSPGSWHAQAFVCALQEGLCHTQVCCTQSPCSRSLLTCSSTGDTQTQFWLGPCGLGVHFVPFPGLNSSGDQVLGERSVPGGLCVIITSPVPATQLPGCPTRAPSQVCLLWKADLRPRLYWQMSTSQDPRKVSSWEPAQSLVEDAFPGTRIVVAPCLPALAVTSLSLCLWELTVAQKTNSLLPNSHLN